MATNLEIEHWQSFISGNTQSFKVLYDLHVDMLFSYGMSYKSDGDFIKDCIHDLFVDLYRYRSSLAVDVNVKAYLLSSLRRKIMYNVKKNDQQIHQASTDVFGLGGVEPSVEDRWIDGEDESEQLASLRTEILKLSRRQQEVLYLRFHCEMSYEQISKVMDISVPTCRTLIYRAVKQLRQQLDRVSVVSLMIMVFYKKIK